MNMEKMAAEEKAVSATQARLTPQPLKQLKLPLPSTLPPGKNKRKIKNEIRNNFKQFKNGYHF